MAALSVALVLLVVAIVTPGAARAEGACEQLRTPATLPLVKALADRQEEEIRSVLTALAKTPAFSIPVDPRTGRRPYRESYAIQLSDRQLERRVRNFFGQIERQAARLRRSISRRRAASLPPDDTAAAIRDLLAIARGFPEWKGRAQALARTIGDAVIQTSRMTAFPAVPLQPGNTGEEESRYITSSLKTAIRRCPSLKASLRNGWLVSTATPELHYAETSVVGEAMVLLARDTGERRFLDWARSASGWLTSRPIAADFSANALAAGLDAELFILTAETKYLERALDWATFGVLPAFAPVPESIGQDRVSEPPETYFFSRLALDELAPMTRAMVHLSTAVAAAPLDAVSDVQARGVYSATTQAHALLQKRALQGRRLQYPADLIVIALDIERAQLAGARLKDPDPVAMKHAIAHGVDRLQRFIRLPRAASGCLLNKLQMRGWSGVHRRPPWTSGQKAAKNGQ